MTNIKELSYKILSYLNNESKSLSFEALALEVFHFQYNSCLPYQLFCNLLKINPRSVNRVENIPFLPVSLFKNYSIKSFDSSHQKVFRSSGTTGQLPSQHFIKDLVWYDTISKMGFESIYGSLDDYLFFGLLPGYLERSDSSLIHMVNAFIVSSEGSYGGFYLDQYDRLIEDIDLAQNSNKKILLIGVSFALLDLAEKIGSIDWKDIIIMETGGMKGRKQEIIRSELHEKLINAFNVSQIHSEYGMTELLSQAYARHDGRFKPIKSMSVFPGKITDPLSMANYNEQCILKIIDLANIYTCSFIETEDIGRVFSDQTFEVLGRMDNSEMRGCNLMYTHQ